MGLAGPRDLSEQQLVDWLRLIRTEGVGPRSFQSLINHFGGAAEALRELPALSDRRGVRDLHVVSEREALAEIERLRRFGGRFVARGDAGYPRTLAAIDSAPPLVAAIGPLDLSARPMVSIVGSRNASLAGLKMAERLARDLASAGFCIVSGLARGIDARAHQAALDMATCAVVAGGLDRLYPEENRDLFSRICDSGAVISEMPFGWTPRGRDFPRRNRIVAGLSFGTIVVEAARRSGSLITARFANEQGRMVFAVPGSPLDPRAEGPNDLIREGATLVRSGDDVLEALRPMVGADAPPERLAEPGDAADEPLWSEADWLGAGLSAAVGPATAPYEGWEEAASDVRERVMSLLTAAPTDPDELARAVGVPIRDMNLMLYALESEARLERHAGGLVSVRPD